MTVLLKKDRHSSYVSIVAQKLYSEIFKFRFVGEILVQNAELMIIFAQAKISIVLYKKINRRKPTKEVFLNNSALLTLHSALTHFAKRMCAVA